MSLKRILLVALTAIVVFLVSAELLSSLTEPQVQGQISLYQTNLVLQASEWSGFQKYPQAQALLGRDPRADARQAYEKTIQSLRELPTPTAQQSQQISQAQLNLGILEAVGAKTSTLAPQTWELVAATGPNSDRQLAQTLQQLWQTPPIITPQAEVLITNHLTGWFQAQALQRLYQVENNTAQLNTLQQTGQELAQAAVIRLALVAVLPLAGSVLGIILLVVWGIRQYRHREPVLPHLNLDIPWSSETTLAVMVGWFVAFFGISFLIVPLVLELIGGRGLVATPFGQAIYALITYSLMMVAGFGILIYTWEQYPQPIFQRLSFSGRNRWWAWSLGAYFVALPLVLLTSVFSQQLLHNQGGGNPLLEVILASHDYRSFAILWFMVAVMAPIFEETLFRGFLLPSLLPSMRPVIAMLTSGGLFAIAHLNAADLLPLAVLGTILGYVYWRSGNILASILLHGIWNSGSFIGLLLLSP